MKYSYCKLCSATFIHGTCVAIWDTTETTYWHAISLHRKNIRFKLHIMKCTKNSQPDHHLCKIFHTRLNNNAPQHHMTERIPDPGVYTWSDLPDKPWHSMGLLLDTCGHRNKDARVLSLLLVGFKILCNLLQRVRSQYQITWCVSDCWYRLSYFYSRHVQHLSKMKC